MDRRVRLRMSVIESVVDALSPYSIGPMWRSKYLGFRHLASIARVVDRSQKRDIVDHYLDDRS